MFDITQKNLETKKILERHLKSNKTRWCDCFNALISDESTRKVTMFTLSVLLESKTTTLSKFFIGGKRLVPYLCIVGQCLCTLLCIHTDRIQQHWYKRHPRDKGCSPRTHSRLHKQTFAMREMITTLLDHWNLSPAVKVVALSGAIVFHL